MRAFTLALAFAAALLFGNTAFAAQVKIGYTPSIDIAPIFVAIEEGFFAKRGLEVEMQPGNGSVMIAGLSSNSLQISNPTVPTFLQAVDAGLDLVLISGDNFTKPGIDEFAVVTRTGVNTAKPADYVGKKVGVSTIGAFLHVLFVEWLNKNGVDPKKVSFVEIPFPQMADVLKGGTVDAVITVEPFVARMVGLPKAWRSWRPIRTRCARIRRSISSCRSKCWQKSRRRTCMWRCRRRALRTGSAL